MEKLDEIFNLMKNAKYKVTNDKNSKQEKQDILLPIVANSRDHESLNVKDMKDALGLVEKHAYSVIGVYNFLFEN